MDMIALTLKFNNSNEYVDVEVPYDFLIYQLVELLTIRFKWATSSIDKTNHQAKIKIPGGIEEYVDIHRSLDSLNALDGTVITIIPEDNTNNVVSNKSEKPEDNTNDVDDIDDWGIPEYVE